jgi:hypothetical protein
MKKLTQLWARFFARSYKLALTFVAPVCLVAGPSWGQDTGNRAAPPQKYVTLLGIHSATVAPDSMLFGSVSANANLYGTSAEENGTLTLGFGAGNANDGLGLQFTASGTPATRNFDSFGYFGIKAAHRLQNSTAPTFVGLAIDRFGGWGEAFDTDPSATLVLTRFTNLTMPSSGENYPIMMSIGAGSDVKDQFTQPGVFLGAGVGLTDNIGVSAAWNGSYTDIGTAFKFGSNDNLRFAVAVLDAFNEADRQQISFGVGWSYTAVQRR